MEIIPVCLELEKKACFQMVKQQGGMKYLLSFWGGEVPASNCWGGYQVL